MACLGLRARPGPLSERSGNSVARVPSLLRSSRIRHSNFKRSQTRPAAFKDADGVKRNGEGNNRLHTRLAIIGSGPAAHTAAIYAARAELEPILFEGWMAGGLPPGGQLTTTTYVENFPGFVEPVLGIDLTDKFRQHSVRYGTRIFTETVTSVDLNLSPAAPPTHIHTGTQPHPASPVPLSAPHRPFTLWTPERTVTADAVIVATGASARRLTFPGSGEEAEGGFWNRGISACAICDGTSPLIRNNPVAVVGGGDSAMEEAVFLTRYASKVYIVHRFDYFEASKAMARRALSNPKIEVLWRAQVVEARGNAQGNLGSIVVAQDVSPSARKHSSASAASVGSLASVDTAGGTADGGPQIVRRELEVGGLFFAIGHRPATDFLNGQLQLDELGYIMTVPGSTATSVPGVFAAGDVADSKFRQAIVAAGTGCMAALEAERYLQALDAGAPAAAAATVAELGLGGMPQQYTASPATAAKAAPKGTSS